jgi:protein TonB
MEVNKILSADVLDIIFEGKNKAYGAYELRKSYNSRMSKAMIATGSMLLLVFISAIAANFIGRKKPQDDFDIKDVEMAAVVKPDPPPPPIVPPPKAPPPPVVNQVQFTPPIVKKDEEIVKPQEIQDVKEDQVISTQTIKSDITTQIVQAPVFDEGTKVVELPVKKSDENEIFTKVEIEAGFPGGVAAFKKYLERNLNGNIPVENEAPRGTYTVIVKFVVSRSGAISDVIAETNIGYGMEEEAIGTIKKSPNWTPAQQNGSIVNAYRRQAISFVVP